MLTDITSEQELESFFALQYQLNMPVDPAFLKLESAWDSPGELLRQVVGPPELPDILWVWDLA